MHVHAGGGGGLGGLLLLPWGLATGGMLGDGCCLHVLGQTHVFSGVALLWYQTLGAVC
jgi:hypothetical protein